MTGAFTTADALLAAAGRDVGTTGWVDVDARRRDLFTASTGDPGGPDGVAAFLVLSLAAATLGEVFTVPGATFAVNYGLDGMWFGPPVPLGARVRLRVRIEDTVRRSARAVDVALGLVVERGGAAEPACTGRLLARYQFEPQAGGTTA